MNEQPPAVAAENRAERTERAAAQVVSIHEKGVAVASSERRPAVTKVGDGMVLQISLGEFVKIAGLLLIAASIYFGIKYDLRDIKTAQEYQSAQLKELSGKWQLQQMDIYDIKIALAAAGIWKGPLTVTNLPANPNGQPGAVTIVPQANANKPTTPP